MSVHIEYVDFVWGQSRRDPMVGTTASELGNVGSFAGHKVSAFDNL